MIKNKGSIFRDGKFWNLDKVRIEPKSGSASLLYRFFFEDRGAQEPKSAIPIEKRSTSDFTDAKKDDLRITWLGHAALLIEIDGRILLTDPSFSKRASPIDFAGPKRFHPLAISIKDLPEIDAVIISHDHYDHLDHQSIVLLKRKTRFFYTPLGVGKRLIGWGVPKEKVIELDWWQEARLDGVITLVPTPAQHFSGRGFFDRNETLWASWVIIGREKRIYFSGDSGIFNGFKDIGDHYGSFDFTLMHIGAYAEEWPPMHMTPEEAVLAHKWLRGEVFIPIHWGTFRMAFHPWKEPVERLYRELKKENIPFAIPMVGQSVSNPKPFPDVNWWNELE